MAVKPFNLAVLIPCCAVERDGGIAVSSRLGPQIEMMAELVGTTTIYGYDPPTTNVKLEDRTDFVMRPAGGRIRLVSLGPKGSYRDWWSRRQRVKRIVERDSASWDVLSTPLVNRRVGLFFKYSKCRRIMAQNGDHSPTAARSTPVPWRKKAIIYLGAVWTERTYRKMARETLFFVNGEALLPYYERGGATVGVVRTSARREKFSFHADDRLNGPAPKLMTLSRLSAIKGVDDAIKAFALLRNGALPDAELHIVGAGPDEAMLRDLSKELGVDSAVVWHGWVPIGPEMFELVQQMDLLLTLSHSESLPNTVWECMAQSLLVVTTPVGAMPYVFEDGVDVLFVPEYDPEAAAAAVERLAKDRDLRQALLARGRETSSRASVEAVCEELLERMATAWPELRAEN